MATVFLQKRCEVWKCRVSCPFLIFLPSGQYRMLIFGLGLWFYIPRAWTSLNLLYKLHLSICLFRRAISLSLMLLVFSSLWNLEESIRPFSDARLLYQAQATMCFSLCKLASWPFENSVCKSIPDLSAEIVFAIYQVTLGTAAHGEAVTLVLRWTQSWSIMVNLGLCRPPVLWKSRS